MTTKRTIFVLVVLVSLLLLGTQAVAQTNAGLAGPPSDRGVQPVWYDNNPQGGDTGSNCGFFGANYQELRSEDLDGAPDGFYTLDNGHLSLEIYIKNTAGGPIFDWWIADNSPVKALPGIFVKGGDNGNWYDYSGFEDVLGVVGANYDGEDTDFTEPFNDIGLHSPVNQSNDKFYGLSHISFCYELPPDAFITIEPDDVNEVGEDHTFIITVWEDSTADGVIGDFELAAGEDVTVSFSSTADPQADQFCTTGDGTGFLSDGITSDLGKCEVTVTSESVGTIIATASADVAVDGEIISVTTDGSTTPNGGQNSDPAKKYYVDASISISPDGVNEVGDEHTFTITVTPHAGEVDDVVTVNFINYTLSHTDPVNIVEDTCGALVGSSCKVTFTSDTVQTVSIDANTEVYFEEGGFSDTVARATDGNSGPSGNDGATKYEVDASIKVTPDDVNEVGEEHIFTIEVIPDAGEVSEVSIDFIDFTLSNPTTLVSNTCDEPIAGNTCTVTISSDEVETVHIDASTEVTFTEGGFSDTVARATDGNSGPLGNDGSDKYYVSASIKVTPDDVNEVGEQHTFTIEVIPDAGEVSEVSIDFIDFTLSDPTTLVSNTCDEPIAGNTCTVTISSDEVEIVHIDASTEVTFTEGGFSDTVARATDGNSGPLGNDGSDKYYVNASISIAPDGVNEAGEEHKFTITVTPDAGDVSGVVVDFINFTLSDPATLVSDTCGALVGNSCTVTISSATVQTVHIDASTEVTFTEGSFSDTVARATDGNSGPLGNDGADKYLVDAKIEVAPDDLNGIGEEHTFTITVTPYPGEVDDSVVVDFINFTLSDASKLVSDTCGALVGNTCTVTVNSDVAASVTINANTEVTFTEGGFSDTVARSTDGLETEPGSGIYNSGPATKEWVAASLFWVKHDHLGQLLGGATFEVCQTHSYNSETGTLTALDEPDCVTVVDDTDGADDTDPNDGSIDEDGTGGEFLLTGLYFGTYTLEEIAAPELYFPDETVITVDIIDLDDSDGIANNGPDVDVSAIYIWVNVPGRSQLAPTNEECQAFYDETAQDLYFTVNKAGNISPGRFFYYNLISYSGSEITFNIETWTTGASEAVADGAKVWIIVDGLCEKIDAEITFDDNNNVQIVVPAGLGVEEVVFRVEYKSPKGDAQVGDVHHFETYIGGNLVFHEMIEVFDQ